MTRFPRVALGGCALAFSAALTLSFPEPLQAQTGQEAPKSGWEETSTDLPFLSGPINASDLINLPVRTYGGAPPVAAVDDLLVKADGRVARVVIDNGHFLQMGLDGKRVALPYDAVAVPGVDGKPAYLRINIARNYGEVIREFRSELISPTDYSVKAILGSALSTSDTPGAGNVVGLWIDQNGTVTHLDVNIAYGSSFEPRIASIPFGNISMTRLSPTGETRLSTTLRLDDVRALPATGGGF